MITEIFADDPLLISPSCHEAEEVGLAICSPKRAPDGTLAAAANFKLH